MSGPILELAQISKSFGALIVSDGISLKVEPGECHALIGPNGAGKTTLIGQITGEIAPDGGAIRFDGSDITETPAHKRPQLGLARSFQVTEILPTLSVRENVLTAIQLNRGSRWSFRDIGRHDRLFENDAAEALSAVRLYDRADHPASTLAHGEKRSLELAMTLAQRPRLLLLDEPMAGTGPNETGRMVELLKSIKRRHAILLVEHDMEAVFALADRVSVLVNGKVVATGSPEEIRNNEAVQDAYLGDGTP